MKIVRENIKWLNEKYIGSVFGFRKEVDIVMNPSSLDIIGAWSRGISDDKGNMYISDGGAEDISHRDMIQFLTNEGLMRGSYYSEYQIYWGYKNCIAWQRKDNSNELWLSESYDWKEMDKHMAYIKELSLSVQERYPAIEFIFERLKY